LPCRSVAAALAASAVVHTGTREAPLLATERTTAGRFPPGRSGNPAGRPPGARNKSTVALEDALADRADELVEVLLRAATEGKAPALRICFDRLAPPRKGRPVPFALPPLASHGDVLTAAAGIVAGMAAGELTPQEAQEIFKVLEAFARVPTSRARPGQAPPTDFGTRGPPREPADACKSSDSAAGTGAEHPAAFDTATSPATPGHGGSADAGAAPPGPVETCKSSGSANRAGGDIDAGTAIASKPTNPGVAPENSAAMAATPRDPPIAAPVPLIASSGDLIADRRYERARHYEQAGDLPAAAELLLQALERAPHFASAWFALGDIREKLADRPGAVAAFRKALDVDRGDSHGAGLRLVRLGAAGPGPPMTPDYVRALFDQYAPRFDAELAGLAYQGPQLLRLAVERVAGAGVRFERMLDLGCGTGLAGAAFAPLCRTAVGIDLSPAMIEIARRRNVYVDLAVADMTERLAREPDSSADLVVAADAFVYLADLAPVCRQAARVLVPHGFLAFSVETHRGQGVILGEKLRWAHAAGYVSAALDGAGLEPRVLVPASTRREGGIPVLGLVVVAAPA
jgi:predicted TPR repeat methyltransferase